MLLVTVHYWPDFPFSVFPTFRLAKRVKAGIRVTVMVRVRVRVRTRVSVKVRVGYH